MSAPTTISSEQAVIDWITRGLVDEAVRAKTVTLPDGEVVKRSAMADGRHRVTNWTGPSYFPNETDAVLYVARLWRRAAR